MHQVTDQYRPRKQLYRSSQVPKILKKGETLEFEHLLQEIVIVQWTTHEWVATIMKTTRDFNLKLMTFNTATREWL